MGYTVHELLERISSRELSEWIVYNQLEPFGQDADWLGSAIVASTVANVNRGKGQKAYTADDFMPKPGKSKKVQTPEEMLQFAAMFTLAAGGEDNR